MPRRRRAAGRGAARHRARAPHAATARHHVELRAPLPASGASGGCRRGCSPCCRRSCGVLWRWPALGRPLGRHPGPDGHRRGRRSSPGRSCVLVRLGGGPRPVSFDTSAAGRDRARQRAQEARWYLIVTVLGPLAGQTRRATRRRRVAGAPGERGGGRGWRSSRSWPRRGDSRAPGARRSRWRCSCSAAMGVTQLLPGYLDVYPIALLVLALYLWTALRVTRWRRPSGVADDGTGARSLHLRGPPAARTVGARRRAAPVRGDTVASAACSSRGARDGHGGRRHRAGLRAAVRVAGVAGRGGGVQRPQSSVSRATSSLLPLDYLFGRTHAAEVAHTLFLVGSRWAGRCSP